MRVYKEFVDEQLMPNSTRSINESIKKKILNKKIKVFDKTKEL